MYPDFKIFNGEIYLYNICAVSAFLIAIWIFVKRTKNLFRPEVQDNIIALMGADIPFIITGAILHNKFAYANSVSSFFNILFINTGIAFLGGLIGGLIGFFIFFPLIVGKKIPMVQVMNELVPSLIAGHAIGRIGCLLGGCCYGKPSAYGIVYKAGTPAYEVYGAEKIFPVPLAETVLLFLLLIIALAVKKNLVSIYLSGYSVIRFFLEFQRGDDRGGHGILSPAQKICIGTFMITICINCILLYRKNSLKPGKKKGEKKKCFVKIVEKN